MLSVRGLQSFYGQAHVLRDVSFAVREGEVLGLVGRNGAGKSTCLKSLMQLRESGLHTRGSITLRGVELVGWPVHRIAGLGVGYVPEEKRIFGDLTVLENLRAGSKRGDGQRAAAWGVERVLGLFPALAERLHHRGGLLSGGEQQMLAVGRTLMGHPDVLLLDEPFEGLAPRVRGQVMEALGVLKGEGMTMVLCEQSLVFVEALADRTVTLEQGQMLPAGVPPA